MWRTCVCGCLVVSWVFSVCGCVRRSCENLKDNVDAHTQIHTYVCIVCVQSGLQSAGRGVGVFTPPPSP